MILTKPTTLFPLEYWYAVELILSKHLMVKDDQFVDSP